MTDGNNDWGQLGAGILGYFIGAGTGGNLFGGCGVNGKCAMPIMPNNDEKIAAISAKLDDMNSGSNTKAILDATIAGDSQVRSDIGALTKDVYSLNIQQLINEQNYQRNLDNQFCKTQEFIAADGNLTRSKIAAFETRYLEDRIHDRDLTIARLQNELTIAPVACGLSAVNSKLDSVIGCAGVRVCNDTCNGFGYGRNPYTLPPLTGSSSVTTTYNPNVAAATA